MSANVRNILLFLLFGAHWLQLFPCLPGLGLVLPLYLDNDPFGVGMHAVSYFLIRRRMATDKVHLLLVPDVDLILQDSSLLSESHETPF